ncbi:MAG: hypothetical protein J5728_06940 [Lachnospiraceae bacterium]|nr:hypothetical protein [Lachnospiraceae bacterium]
MRNKIIIAVIAVAALLAAFKAGTVFGAGSASPGSQGDPLVTLSYLNSRLEGLGDTGGASSSDTGFSRVSLTKGQSLILTDGSELIVYSGNGTVLGTSGMLSITDAQMFPAGTSAVMYAHFLGIGGNSGVKASGNMTIYVKGGYGIE